VGQFDGCLFSLHRPQSVGRTMEQEVGGGEFGRMVSLAFLFGLTKLITSSYPLPVYLYSPASASTG
jgi:hypothetical protein